MMLLLQIYSLLLLLIASITSLKTGKKDNIIGAYLLAPIIAYIITTMFRL